MLAKNICVDTFANNVVTSCDRAHQAYIIFDCNDKNLIKSHERHRWTKGCVPRQYVLSCNTIFPAKDVFMKNDANLRHILKSKQDCDKEGDSATED